MKVNVYERPKTAGEAVALLAKYQSLGKDVRVLAGGTDLVMEIQERKLRPDGVLDLGAIDSLKTIRLNGENLEIGAMATFAQVEKHPLVLQHCPMLAKAAGSVGSPQIRTSGTVGGNFANGAAAADSVPAMLAAGARVLVQDVNGTKVLPAEDVLLAKTDHVLAKDQLLLAFLLPLCDKKTNFAKIGRRKALAIARINIAVAFAEDEGGRMKDVCIALGAVGKTAYRVPEIEAVFNGKPLTKELIDEGAAQIDALVAKKLGSRPTAPYKRKIAAAVLKNCFRGFLA